MVYSYVWLDLEELENGEVMSFQVIKILKRVNV